MTSAENTPAQVGQARIDVYALTIGANSEGKPFEVVAVYLHELPSYLPVPVIKAMLKAEFEPDALRLLLSGRFAVGTAALNTQFLRRIQDASLTPLRSETYGAPPRQALWHFFALADSRSLANIIRELETAASPSDPSSARSETSG